MATAVGVATRISGAVRRVRSLEAGRVQRSANINTVASRAVAVGATAEPEIDKGRPEPRSQVVPRFCGTPAWRAPDIGGDAAADKDTKRAATTAEAEEAGERGGSDPFEATGRRIRFDTSHSKQHSEQTFIAPSRESTLTGSRPGSDKPGRRRVRPARGRRARLAAATAATLCPCGATLSGITRGAAQRCGRPPPKP